MAVDCQLDMKLPPLRMSRLDHHPTSFLLLLRVPGPFLFGNPVRIVLLLSPMGVNSALLNSVREHAHRSPALVDAIAHTHAQVVFFDASSFERQWAAEALDKAPAYGPPLAAYRSCKLAPADPRSASDLVSLAGRSIQAKRQTYIQSILDTNPSFTVVWCADPFDHQHIGHAKEKAFLEREAKRVKPAMGWTQAFAEVNTVSRTDSRYGPSLPMTGEILADLRSRHSRPGKMTLSQRKALKSGASSLFALAAIRASYANISTTDEEHVYEQPRSGHQVYYLVSSPECAEADLQITSCARLLSSKHPGLVMAVVTIDSDFLVLAGPTSFEWVLFPPKNKHDSWLGCSYTTTWRQNAIRSQEEILLLAICLGHDYCGSGLPNVGYHRLINQGWLKVCLAFTTN